MVGNIVFNYIQLLIEIQSLLEIVGTQSSSFYTIRALTAEYKMFKVS